MIYKLLMRKIQKFNVGESFSLKTPFNAGMEKITETLKIDETKKRLKETNQKIHDFFKLDAAVADDFYLKEPTEAPIKKLVNLRKKKKLDEEEKFEEISGIRTQISKKKSTRRLFNRDGTVNVLR